jgi:hypothetical protein
VADCVEPPLVDFFAKLEVAHCANT